MNRGTRPFSQLLLVVGLIGFDQLAKAIWYTDHIGVLNKGGVWGLFPDRWWWPVITFVFISVLTRFWWVSKGGYMLVYSFLLAGGLSNWIDRLAYDGVRDIIYYPYFGFYGNIADIYLALGFCLWIYYSKMKRS